jgi:hypothetical protein
MIDCEVLKQTLAAILKVTFISLPLTLLKIALYATPILIILGLPIYYLGPVGVFVDVVVLLVCAVFAGTYDHFKNEKALQHLLEFKMPDDYTCDITRKTAAAGPRYTYYILSVYDEHGKKFYSKCDIILTSLEELKRRITR